MERGNMRYNMVGGKNLAVLHCCKLVCELMVFQTPTVTAKLLYNEDYHNLDYLIFYSILCNFRHVAIDVDLIW